MLKHSLEYYGTNRQNFRPLTYSRYASGIEMKTSIYDVLYFSTKRLFQDARHYDSSRLATPIEVVNSNSSVGIGINSFRIRSTRSRSDGRFVIATPIESDQRHMQIICTLKIFFLLVCASNVIVTISSFLFASKVDLSLVEIAQNKPTPDFQKISDLRTSEQLTFFIMTLVLLILGMFSVFMDNVFGMSSFAILLILFDLASIPFVPNFFYILRNVFDAILLYIVLSLRSKLMYNFTSIQSYSFNY